MLSCVFVILADFEDDTLKVLAGSVSGCFSEPCVLLGVQGMVP